VELAALPWTGVAGGAQSGFEPGMGVRNDEVGYANTVIKGTGLLLRSRSRLSGRLPARPFEGVFCRSCHSESPF